MSRFVLGVSDDFQQECLLAMLHDHMNIYFLMVNAPQVEDTRAKRKNRDTKKARSFDSGKEYTCYQKQT